MYTTNDLATFLLAYFDHKALALGLIFFNLLGWQISFFRLFLSIFPFCKSLTKADSYLINDVFPFAVYNLSQRLTRFSIPLL